MCFLRLRCFFDDFSFVLRTLTTLALANDLCFSFWTPILLTDWKMNCINCRIATNRSNAIGNVLLEDQAVFSRIRQWTGLQTITNEHHICSSCWTLANESLRAGQQGEVMPPTSTVGHRSVCVHCGRSVLRTRSHLLGTSNEREARIHNVITEWIIPNRIESSRRICHACWLRADRISQHYVSRPSTSADTSNVEPLEVLEGQSGEQVSENMVQHTTNYVDQIILPKYIRPVETERKCFIEGCVNQECNRVALSIRKSILEKYNFYIPANNRLCDQHSQINIWELLYLALNHYLNNFTVEHIQDMLNLKTMSREFFDFENTDNLDDDTMHFWTGLYKEQFNSLFTEIAQFGNIRKGRTALAAYLMKLRTGDSNERVSTLFKIPRTTLESLIKDARDILAEYFVPHHLGFNHINRQEVVNRTLIIPKGLFGSHNGEERPVALFDGTYCYVQKSSNYSYQKKTYSLHKYTNLVKPFMIVCSDGYILDVLGPYPATSDADILKYEFQKTNSELKNYFQPGDAFVLDRGFRDALPLLNNFGYRTFVPGTLAGGESQMSTVEANKSRAVTICRWVVEVVNGRFKRDFKLFRQDYFNTASKHLIKDFEVAAALINRFHPPITDCADAVEIITIINEKMYLNNTLADVVEQYNLNRRRANFTSIDARFNDSVNDFPQLSFSDLILISLGTYQIKQARSYFGDHTRANGRFEIEVCREVDSNLLRELSTSPFLL